VFTFVAVVVVVLLVVGIVYDVVARRRGTYRTASEWQAISRRRRSHFRRTGDARSETKRNR
jgi:hypothetical protein